MNEIELASAVRLQLERITVNPGFATASRLCHFLRFVVEEELAGRGADIKEYVVGVKVYHKSASYDPRTDATVRVDAGKLRARLNAYYGTAGRDDPVVISVPKGTYVPCFEVRALGLTEAPAKPRRGGGRNHAIAIVAGVLLFLAACAAWIPRHLFRRSALATPASRIMAVGWESGESSDPSFSPDGSMVAFSWNGENPEKSDIYVKVVDATKALRLTSNRARDTRPAWSPDGRQIAFLRNSGPAGEVYVVSALGGGERRVTASSGESLSWTADSRSLLVLDRKSPVEPYAGFVVSTESGERRQITFPPTGSYTGDYDLVASPDGRHIAFCRMINPPVAELWLMTAGGGRAEKLNESRRYIRGLAWTPDSRRIVYSSQQTGFSALWVMNIESPAVPSLLPGLETDAVRPSIPRWPGRQDRIAYQRREEQYRLWRATVSGRKMSDSWSILPSQRNDWFPQISPDGKWITFASDRAGRSDIWVSRLDGTELRNLTAESHFVSSGSPRWSPDGGTIGFDAHEEIEKPGIYTIPASGGSIRRLTSGKSEDVRPSWSADGTWIYFTSDRTGRREIWKTPTAGGAAAQVTTSGGFEPFESPDGSTLYFLEHARSTKLWGITSGGAAKLVLSDVHEGRWSVTEAGIYFIDSSRRICRLDKSGQVVCVGAVVREGSATGGFGVSRDGKEIVYVQPEPVRSTLMMAEGSFFR